ncbi:MAG: hypothetical protein WCP79_14775 [Bacillota bacterium]
MLNFRVPTFWFSKMIFHQGMLKRKDCLKNYDGGELSAAVDAAKFIENGEYDGSRGFTVAHFSRPEQIDELMLGFPLEKVRLMAVESFGSFCEEKLNQLPDDKFQQWMEIFYGISEHKAILGVSDHLLYIGRKTVGFAKTAGRCR